MERDTRPDLARAVRTRRESRGLSRARLAELTSGEVSESTIVNVEKGQPPQLRGLEALARALGTTVGVLLGEADDSPFIAELRALEAELDDRGREAVLAVARSQANIKPAALGPATRRAIEAAKDDVAELDAGDERATRRRVAESSSQAKPGQRKRGGQR